MENRVFGDYLGEKLGVKCTDTEIQACGCVRPKNDVTIICKFGNRKLRDAFLQKRKDARKISGKDLELKAADVRAFINESLTNKISNFLIWKEISKKKSNGTSYGPGRGHLCQKKIMILHSLSSEMNWTLQKRLFETQVIDHIKFTHVKTSCFS